MKNYPKTSIFSSLTKMNSKKMRKGPNAISRTFCKKQQYVLKTYYFSCEDVCGIY
eukprot:UN24173